MNETKIIEMLEGRLRQWLTPPVFFLGMIVGFAACCVGGRLAPAATFQEFQRFHRAINPRALYYPTSLQVRNLATRQLPREKIAVIVGGSSIMQGFGQSARDLWTSRLQHELGAEYRVLNLAMPGGAPNELGQLTAEMLLRDHDRLIYVCNCGLEKFAKYPDGTLPVYRYFYHDARARGLLAQFPERDAALLELEGERRAHETFEELALQTRANAYMSFNDLWNVIGYEVGFTVWTKWYAYHPWRARKRQPDEPYLGQRYASDLTEQKLIIHDETRPNSADDWARFESQVRHSVPDALRSKTLVTVNRSSPYYVRIMEAETTGVQARLDRKVAGVIEHLRACGLSAVDGCAAMTPDDFLDRLHLSTQGGEKLASALAPAIRDLARRLRYIEGAVP